MSAANEQRTAHADPSGSQLRRGGRHGGGRGRSAGPSNNSNGGATTGERTGADGRTNMQSVLNALEYVPMSQRPQPQPQATGGGGGGGRRGGRGGGGRGRGGGNSKKGKGTQAAAAAAEAAAAPQRPLPPPQVGSLAALPTRAHDLADALIDRSYECMNCLEIIDLAAATWGCGCCYSVFHLKCMQRWAQEGTRGGNGNSTSGAGVGAVASGATTSRSGIAASSHSSAAAAALSSGTFQCPQCRGDQPVSSLATYKCFCGKAHQPHYDPFIIPHSCGATCGKRRAEHCPHRCTLQCHPGPCGECLVTVGPKKCPCGSTTYSYRCGQADPETTCDNACGKLLACGVHLCDKQCHSGGCGPCEELVPMTCACGKESGVRRLCGSAFRCARRCGKVLSCGNHRCSAVCHDGECPLCPRDVAVVDACPCGARLLSGMAGVPPRASCLDSIPCCGGSCGKLLPCGRHSCPLRCHEEEDCPPCAQRTDAACACRLTRKLVACGEADGVRCTRLCGTRLSCGRHYCREGCCPDRGNAAAESHRCLAVCDTKLPCGHTCTELCHAGACPPCVHFTTDTLVCACGRSQLPPPQPCGTTAPWCAFACQRDRGCGHREMPPHRCHFGDCPPCAEPVTRVCVGGHSAEVSVPCAQAPGESTCDSPCCKLLPCGHSCDRACHAGACVTSERPCTQSCEAVHGVCGHPCGARCHHSSSSSNNASPSSPDACPRCHVRERVTCACTHVRKQLPCHQIQQLLEKRRAEARAEWEMHANNKWKNGKKDDGEEGVKGGGEGEDDNGDDNDQGEAEEEGPPEIRTLVLPCDDDCFHAQRMNLLASRASVASVASVAAAGRGGGLGGGGASAFSSGGGGVGDSGGGGLASAAGEAAPYFYSTYLWERAQNASERTVIEQAEKRLRSFVEGQEELVSLPPASAEKRAVYHALAPFYGVRSESYDNGPARSVLLMKSGTGGGGGGVATPAPPVPVFAGPTNHTTDTTTTTGGVASPVSPSSPLGGSAVPSIGTSTAPTATTTATEPAYPVSLPPITLLEATRSKRNDPCAFYEMCVAPAGSKLTTRCVHVNGESVNEATVTRYLAEMTGSFVYGGEVVLDSHRTRATLAFSNAPNQRRGFAMLRKKQAPFKFWIPED